MPEKDVFLPWDGKTPMYAHKRLEDIKEPARTAITRAVASNPKARMNAWFVDGVDHVHLEVWDGKPKKS